MKKERKKEEEREEKKKEKNEKKEVPMQGNAFPGESENPGRQVEQLFP